MNVPAVWLSAWWDAIGWTMLHFLWVGAALALVSAVLTRSLRRRTPEVRYAVALTTLASMALASGSLFVWAIYHQVAIVGTEVSRAERAVVELPTPVHTETPASGSQMAAGVDRSRPSRAIEAASSDADLGSPPSPGRQPIAIGGTGSAGDRFAQVATLVFHGLTWLWIVGFPLTSLWLLTGIAGAERLRHQCRVPSDDHLQLSCRRLREALLVSRSVAIGISDRVAGPILIGMIRPMIVLPSAALAGWSPEQVEMILLHELAHVRRWDNLVNLLQRMIEATLFFHPAVWWISKQVRLERELCCDAVVLAHTAAPQSYAEMLAQIAAPELMRPALGVSASDQLIPRLRHIFKQQEQPMQVSRFAITVFCGLFLAMGSLMVAWAKSEQTETGRVADADQPSTAPSSDEHPNVKHGSSFAPAQANQAQRTKRGFPVLDQNVQVMSSKVEVCHPVSREIVNSVDVLGTIAPAKTVQIRSLLSGTLQKTLVQPGQSVKEGDVLFQIDPRPYQADVDRAAAEVASAEIYLKQAKIDADRGEKLASQKAIPADELTRKIGERDIAMAKLQVARAQLEIAKLNLSHTFVTSPMAGRFTGQPMDAGNLVNAQTTTLGTVMTVDPMQLSFDVTQSTFLQIRTLLGGNAPSTLPFTVTLIQGGGQREGRVTSIGDEVHPSTGMIHMQAEVPNADGFFIPGMRAFAHLNTSKPYRALLVPKAALLQTIDGGWTISIVNDRNIVEDRPVILGQPRDKSAVIVSGLKPDEWVIMSRPHPAAGQTAEPQRVNWTQ